MITALPTRYAGHSFRSRAEARWAVFFDALEVPWEYEPEAFQLPDGRRYLPDFRLPTVGGAWFEVKGERPTSDVMQPVFLLAKETRRPGFLAWGRVGFPDEPELGGIVVPNYACAKEWTLVLPVFCKEHNTLAMHRLDYDAAVCHAGPYLHWLRGSAVEVRAATVRANTHRFWDPK